MGALKATSRLLPMLFDHRGPGERVGGLASNPHFRPQHLQDQLQLPDVQAYTFGDFRYRQGLGTSGLRGRNGRS